MTSRGGEEIARAIVGVNEEGGLNFAADVKEGEKYCISYVDNRLHNEKSEESIKRNQ